jgi:putative SOS response-associated peptidase YedK
MCGRIVREDFSRYHDAFRIVEPDVTRLTPRFNIAPTQLDLIIQPDDGGRRLVDSRWGLIPAWAKDRSVGSRMFNARAETLLERPAYRPLVGRRRCIIPASGFYEWQAAPTGRGKQPLYIHRADGAPLALAGLWTIWQDPATNEAITSHTIVTCAPNRLMASIHDRMPVILDGAGLDLWLDPTLTDPAAVLPLLAPCPDDVLTAYPVSPAVNNVRNDGPDLIRRANGSGR